jgi:hypothetical protein
LLARAAATPRAKQVAATTIPLDLNRDLEAALDGPIDRVGCAGVGGVGRCTMKVEP